MSKSVRILNRIEYYLPVPIMKILYVSFVHPYLLYEIEAWFAAYQNVTNKRVKVQVKAMRVVASANYLHHASIIFKGV